MILIGSRALALRAPGFLRRQPKDFDFISSEAEAFDWLRTHGATNISATPGNVVGFVDDVPCEFEIVHPGSSAELLTDLVKSETSTPFGVVPSLDMLFTIKQSHRFKKNSPHFWKTLSDWHALRAIGAKVRPEYEAFLKLREKESYQFAVPKLNRTKAKFFADDQIEYAYDHDSIHQAVRTLERPAYQYFSIEGQEVLSSRQKFEACSREIQLLSSVEESSVLAIERSLVPHPGAMTPEKAWRFAFSKICTSIASGWWRQFSFENAPAILRMYPADYFDRFQRGLANGVVKPFRKEAA